MNGGGPQPQIWDLRLVVVEWIASRRCQDTWTLTWVGLTSSVFGRVSVSRPSLNSAFASSALMAVRGEKLRLNWPRLSSFWT